MPRLLTLAIVLTMTLLTTRAAFDFAPATAQPATTGAPSYGAQLRYIGRDGATGLAGRVDDRYIAAVEEDYANYGRVEAEAVPPPPAGPVDLQRLRIPAIGVDATIARFGIDRFGRLDVPQDAVTIGWHPAFSNLPGSAASTFLAAHYMYANSPGTFFELASLQPGDEVTVATTNSQDTTYRVISSVDYPLAAIDMGAILHGIEGHESVVLMTCSGPPNEGEYPLRTVVIALRVPG